MADSVRNRILALFGVPAAGLERYSVRAQAAGRGEVLLYGPILPEEAIPWFDDDTGVSAVRVRNRLNEIAGDVVVRINSPGGDVWEASAIMMALRERRERDDVRVIVDGLAASAASLVMTVGSDIAAAPLASIMVHEASGCMCGTAAEFQTMADFLARKTREMAKVYAARMERDEAAVTAMLTDETWFTASEAVEAGLCDRVLAEEPADPAPAPTALFRARNGYLAAAMAAAD